MKLQPNYYRDRVCLNVLAGSKANAQDIYAAAEGHVLVGVLSKNYPDVDSAVTDMLRYARLIDNALSVGLGAGDPKQSAMVSLIAQQVQPQHVNQVFTGVGASRALLGPERQRGQRPGVANRPRRLGEDLYRPIERRGAGWHRAGGNRHRPAERHGRQLHQVFPDGRPEVQGRISVRSQGLRRA